MQFAKKLLTSVRNLGYLRGISQNQGALMTLTADLFEPHVGTEAIVHLDDGTPFALTLNSVTPEGPVVPREAGDDTPDRAPFR